MLAVMCSYEWGKPDESFGLDEALHITERSPLIEEQQVGGGDAAEDRAVGAIGAGGVQALEDVGGGRVVDAQGVATGGMADGLGDGGLAGGRAADEDDVAVLVDEAAGEQLLDDLGEELRARRPVEALEGEGRSEEHTELQ